MRVTFHVFYLCHAWFPNSIMILPAAVFRLIFPRQFAQPQRPVNHHVQYRILTQYSALPAVPTGTKVRFRHQRYVRNCGDVSRQCVGVWGSKCTRAKQRRDGKRGNACGVLVVIEWGVDTCFFFKVEWLWWLNREFNVVEEEGLGLLVCDLAGLWWRNAWRTQSRVLWAAVEGYVGSVGGMPIRVYTQLEGRRLRSPECSRFEMWVGRWVTGS